MKGHLFLLLHLVASASSVLVQARRDQVGGVKVAQFQHVLQPLEPYAEIVTTSTPAPVPFPSVIPPSVPEATETLGLQYTNTVYIYVLLGMAIPFGLLYLWFAFAGNAKQLQAAFAAVTAALFAFYLSIGLLINLQNPPAFGLSVAFPLFAVALVLGVFFPEYFGWTNSILTADILLVALVYNMTAPVFWPNLGLLAGVPGFTSSPPEVQLISYFTSILFVACLLYLIQIYTGQERSCPPVVNRNLISSFISGFVVTASVAYIAAVGGLMAQTPLEPVGFFDIPSLFSYADTPTYAFLVLWTALTLGGYAVQQARDKQKSLLD